MLSTTGALARKGRAIELRPFVRLVMVLEGQMLGKGVRRWGFIFVCGRPRISIGQAMTRGR